MKAICFPSGDQVGCAICTFGVAISLSAPVDASIPSRRATHQLLLPDPLAALTTNSFPFGDQSYSYTYTSGFEMTLSLPVATSTIARCCRSMCVSIAPVSRGVAWVGPFASSDGEEYRTAMRDASGEKRASCTDPVTVATRRAGPPLAAAT